MRGLRYLGHFEAMIVDFGDLFSGETSFLYVKFVNFSVRERCWRSWELTGAISYGLLDISLQFGL